MVPSRPSGLEFTGAPSPKIGAIHTHRHQFHSCHRLGLPHGSVGCLGQVRGHIVELPARPLSRQHGGLRGAYHILGTRDLPALP